MYLKNLTWQLGAVALAVCGVGASGVSAISTETDTTLKPIHVNDFESAFGIQRPNAEALSDLHLRDHEHLVFGREADQGKLFLANMTLYAPEGLQVVLVERFDGLTSAVDCKDHNGTMSLTFNSKAAFQHAVKTWNFINEAKEKKFLLITNHSGCGPDGERQTYLVTGIREDTKTMTTFLSAQTAPWSEFAGTYDLDLGQANVKTGTKARRGLAGWLKGDFDYDKSKTFDVSAGTLEKKTSILDLSSIKMSCDNCYIKGSLTMNGHVSTKHWKMNEMTLKASPNGLAAALELGTTVNASVTVRKEEHNTELFSAPIPNAGLEIPNIFKLGAVLSFEVGVSASFSGNATVKYGLDASIPDTAQLTADLTDYSKSSATGFDGGDIKPVFDVTALSAGLTLTAYAQPRLSFGIEVHNIAKYDVDITMQIPQVKATLTGAYKEDGLCAPGKETTGVQLTSDIGIEADLNINAKLGKDEDTSAPSYSRKLFGVKHPLYSHCFPLQIPGLGPQHTSKTAPGAVPVSTGTAVPTTLLSMTGVPTASPLPT